MIKWETRRCEPAEAFETLRALKHGATTCSSILLG